MCLLEWDRWRRDVPLWFDIRNTDIMIAKGFDFLCRVVGKSATSELDDEHDSAVERALRKVEMNMR